MGMRLSVWCLSAILPTASGSVSVSCCLIGWIKAGDILSASHVSSCNVTRAFGI
jgi:hypothetical protein